MMNFKKILQTLHIPLWVLKDFFWMIGWAWLSLVFAIPAILTTLLLINYTVGIRKLENFIILFWLSGNTCWLLSEKMDLNTHYISIIFFIFGIGTSIKYLKDSLKSHN